MIELQFINRILEEQSLSIVRENNIDADYFQAYKEEFEFIIEHERQYGQVPDITTFIDKFEDFDVVEISESNRYLVEELKEQYLFNLTADAVNNIAELAETDSRNAVDYLKQKAKELSSISTSYKEGLDIIANAGDRFNEFKRRKEMDGLLGISTGIKELDDILYGWLDADFATIIARTNEGKTWLLLFFLVQAWLQDKKVLLYNGELPNPVMGFRFDTLYRHFSNYGLTRGTDEVNMEQYRDYIDDLKTKENPFIIVKPADIGGRLTVPKLENLIELHEPDIIGIDQITLMEDYRGYNGQPDYKKYEHITEDLYQTAEEYEIPIIAPHQASRDAIKSSKNKEENIPELDDIYGSDAIAHNSKRVISFVKVNRMLKLAVKKNTFGENNKELTMLWDIDTGMMKPFLKTDVSEDGEIESTEQINEEEVSELF